MPSDGNLDLLRLDGQRQAAFGPDFQAGGDGVADVGEGFNAAISLADTTRNRRAFGDPNPVLIPIKGGDELHTE